MRCAQQATTSTLNVYHVIVIQMAQTETHVITMASVSAIPTLKAFNVASVKRDSTISHSVKSVTVIRRVSKNLLLAVVLFLQAPFVNVSHASKGAFAMSVANFSGTYNQGILLDVKIATVTFLELWEELGLVTQKQDSVFASLPLPHGAVIFVLMATTTYRKTIYSDAQIAGVISEVL